MGSVAKWKGKALQMLDHRFKSGRGLQKNLTLVMALLSQQSDYRNL